MGNAEATLPANAADAAIQYNQAIGDAATRALAFKIEDANDREMAADLLGELRDRKARGQKHFEEPKRLAYQTHQAICKLERDVLANTVKAEKHVETQMRLWDDEARRRAAAEEHKRQEEARERERQAREEAKRLEDEALARAAELEQQDPEGAAMVVESAQAEAQQTITQAVEAPPAAAPAPAPKATGRRAKWVARVDKLQELVKAIAAGSAPLNLVEANMTELNKLARTAGAEKEIVPGVMAIDEGSYVGR